MHLHKHTTAPLKADERFMKVFDGNCAQKNICPIKDILSGLGDKWSIYTIILLGQKQKLRFNQLRLGIEGISQRMLTVTLRSLEENGIILRIHHPEIPPKVEYELTDLGKSLLDKLLSLGEWAEDHFHEIIRSRKKYAKRSA